VVDALPSHCRYRVFPKQSYDARPPREDEARYPDDAEFAAIGLGPWDIDEAVDSLWREGKVPAWIDVSVDSYDDRTTDVRLTRCGRFTARDDLLYHRGHGFPPFAVIGPRLPPGWESLQKSGRFRLPWYEQRA
jgi:hypothetical protein